VEAVLITAGASAPEDLVQGIVREVVDKYGGEMDESHVVQEDMHFALPYSLRVLQGSGV
jgi:4-hydroxy-3-methylbut-2-enyl diphosphate reductase